MAEVVLRDSLGVRPGENVTIESWSESIPWARSFVSEARRIGAHPMALYEDEAEYWRSLSRPGPSTLGSVGSHEWAALDRTNAYVFFYGPSDWPRYDALSPATLDRVQGYNPEWYRRAEGARLRGARMWLGRTSPAAAARFGVDLDAWRDELVRAAVVSPKILRASGRRIGRRLARGKTVLIAHPNGTQLELRLKGYPVLLDDGMVDPTDVKAGNNVTSIPGGVVGVALDERYAHGTFVGNRSVNLPDGPALGGQWTFRDHRLASYSYGEGVARFEKPFRKAPAGRDIASYLSIGLNPAISISPQMEDQEAGAVTLRVGGNRFAGGTNDCPFGSWLVLRGADVSVDGRPIVAGGSLA